MAKASEKTVVPMSRREAIRASRVPGETPDPTPIAVPIDSQQPPSLREEMMRFIRAELQKQTTEVMETFEEADDLELEDDEPDLTSAYTVQELTEENPAHYDPEAQPEPENASQEPSEPPETPEPLESEALAPPQGAGGVVEPSTPTP